MLTLLHPAVIHFPIALLLLAAALTAAHLRRPDPWLERCAYGALVLGWWSALAATVTGLGAAALQWPFTPTILMWINWHALTGFAVLGVAGRALIWRKREPQILAGPRRRQYLGMLALLVVLVITSGWLGGELVYTFGVGVAP